MRSSFRTNFSEPHGKPFSTCRRNTSISSGRSPFDNKGVRPLYYPSTGTGKSHLVQALGHCALRAGYDVLFITHNKLLGQLHAAKATNTYERKLQQLAKIDVIAIDDFGLRPMRSPQDEDFHELIAERYERTTTLVTSNLDFEEWGAAFPNKLMGAATIDRLRDGAYRIVLDGETRRKPRPVPEASQATRKASNTGSPQSAARQR